MTRFETANITAAYRSRCEDRIAVIESDERTVIVVADGAGGSGDGAQAAETAILEITSGMHSIDSAANWCEKLQEIDFRIDGGETTAVVVDLRPDGLFGASVGDSQAWIIADGAVTDLTSHQVRKPLLGTSAAVATPFTHGPLSGMLVVATDGFCNYVKRAELPRALPYLDFFEIPRKLVEMVRLPSGELWDDVGIVVCRPRPKQRTRVRYEI